jgi:hypothetical protein
MTYRSFHFKRFKNGLFPTRPSLISLKIGIMKLAKIEVRLLFRPKSLPQKNYRVTNFSIFHDFSVILSLITQPVFIAKTCAWVRWKGILLRKIQKIKKPTTTIFFKKKIGFDDLKWNYSNLDRFLKIALLFICLNTSVWARWKGIFKSKIQKIKKPNNNNVFRFFFKLI